MDPSAAFRLPHRDVQTRGGVPAGAAPVAGRHTTPAITVSFFLASRDPSTMSTHGLANTRPSPPRVHGRTLWATAQQRIGIAAYAGGLRAARRAGPPTDTAREASRSDGASAQASL
ncbi:hypothetical protein L3i22_061580 [Actinoplanes sp. L3-i22]|nr:hypothetical protein L3i22_061580 [Actinoplanes sp. L3-i22]